MTLIAPVNLLKSIPCFAGLNADVLDMLLGSARERYFSKGELLLQEGDPCPGLFVLQSGSVKLYRASLTGEEQIMRVIRPGGCFECAPLFDKGPNPVSAQALESCKAVFIPAASFNLLISNYPEVALQFVPILAMRLRDFLNTIEDFSFNTVSRRIAKLMLQLGERQDEDRHISLSVPLTQHHLACIVGCSRQVLNAYLQELIKKGIIKIEKRRIIVLKPESLLELIGHETRGD
ncbi:MAG: Crp/Fnr family transcriptional regulator [Dehalococcoidales bacterium]|nr:Crp/Fnr family transcriptional regulator [Dehalococcoidales bacterium]